MLHNLPYEIFLEIMFRIYNLNHNNLINLQRFMITEKKIYIKSYDILKDMLKNIIPQKDIIYYNQPYFKKPDWWLKLLYFYTINICNCYNSDSSLSNYCKKCFGIIPIKK